MLPIEVLEYGPLTQALFRESQQDVRKVLSASNMPLLEKADSGEKPFHITASWPRGVELLLELGADIAESVIDAKDSQGNTPINYALKLSEPKSIKLLIDSNAQINLEDTRNIETNLLSGFAQSDEVINVLVCALADRRRKMLSRARRLPRNSLEPHLPLSDNDLLDYNAFSVIETLKKHGLRLPEYYWDVRQGLVYHSSYLSAQLANALYEHGFVRINTVFYGFTPLMTVDYCSLWRRRGIDGLFDLVDWFIDHGVNLKGAIPSVAIHGGASLQNLETNFEIIHRIAFEIGYFAASHIIKDQDGLLLTRLWSMVCRPTLDPCSCFCSQAGCTPASAFARGLMAIVVECCPRLDRSDVYTDITELLQQGVSSRQVSVQAIKDIFRVMTFTQLGMKHTCCEFNKHIPKEHKVITQMILEGRYHLIDFLEPDEIIEVQSEDKYSAMLLDSLMEEFSAQLGKADMSLLDFLAYWWKRMQMLMEFCLILLTTIWLQFGQWES